MVSSNFFSSQNMVTLGFCFSILYFSQFSAPFVLVGKCQKFARKKNPVWESSYRGWKAIIEGA
jgi:hypothetical protein